MNKKPIAIPAEVILAVNFLEPADRGMAYTAIFAHIFETPFELDTLSPAARAAFEMAKIILAPALRRRQRAAEQAAAKKLAKEAAKEVPKEPEKEASTPSRAVQLDQLDQPPQSPQPSQGQEGQEEVDGRAVIDSLMQFYKERDMEQQYLEDIPDYRQHLGVMRQVVKKAYRVCTTAEGRDKRIREQLEWRFPGMYKDIIYNDKGKLLLVPYDKKPALDSNFVPMRPHQNFID